MIPRLEAEEEQTQINALLAAGQRAVGDSEHRAHMRRLEDTILGRQSPRHKAPRITAAMAERFGIHGTPGKEVNTTE